MRSEILRPEYCIRTDSERRTVETWSNKPLSLAPNDWRADMAKDIRAVLATLTAESGDCLSALYISDQPDRSDAENVLFYNVGTSNFRKFAVCKSF